MKLSDYIANFIASQGVKHVFTLPGGFAMHLNDSVHHHGDITPVYMLDERSAGIAAEAYAKYAGLAFCIVSAGPAATNAITPCAASYCDSAPVVYISGQVKAEDLSGGWVRCSGPQEVPITRIVKSITKYQAQIDNAQDIVFELERAVYIATHGRPGPVWLDIPLDIQAEEIDPNALHFTPLSREYGDIPIGQVVSLLRQANCPLFLFGAGALGAREAIQSVNIPFLTTWRAKDLCDYDNPLFVGHPGPVASRAANFALQTCDLLICVGARIDSYMTAWQPDHFAPSANIVTVDIDNAELDFSKISDIAIQADAGEFMRELDKQGYPYPLSWVQRCQSWKKRYPITAITPTYRLVSELSDRLTPNDVIVLGAASMSLPIFNLAFRQKLGQRIYYSNGLGSMGFDLPYAIGAALATGRRVVCITGDGSIMQNIQELEVVRRLNLPIKFFVIDNGGYASIRNSQMAHMKRASGADESSGLTMPHIDYIARALGIEAFYRRSDVRGALEFDGPSLMLIDSGPDERIEPRVMSQMVDGKMVSGTLENLYPFLSADEMAMELGNG